MKLSERRKLLLALLEVYGSQPTQTIQKILYPGQMFWFSRQNQYVLRTLRYLRDQGFIEKTAGNALWQITEEGKKALYGLS